MQEILSTLEDALQARYYGWDRLYRDHEGRRVIVDVEGFGCMSLVHAEPPVLLVRSEVALEQFASVFSNGSLILTNAPGEVFVQIRKGRTGPLAGESVCINGDYDGAGWVVGASSAFSVDDRHEDAPEASREMPVPFFRCVRGIGDFLIVPAAGVFCEKVDGFDITDAVGLKARGFKVQNMSAVSVLTSTYGDGTEETREVASHLNAAVFMVAIPPDNQGIILRKIYDRFHGRQRARVHVDGAFAGWWYEPGEDRKRRWHVSDFGVAAELCAGKSSVQITVEPPSGVALWSVSRVEVFALRPLDGA